MSYGASMVCRFALGCPSLDPGRGTVATGASNEPSLDSGWAAVEPRARGAATPMLEPLLGDICEWAGNTDRPVRVRFLGAAVHVEDQP
eukprot:10561610-Alexandrium_andersonii.AAC.1